MFLASSHTCSPILRPYDWRVLLSYCLFIVSFVLFIAVFASSLIVSIFFNRPSKLGISISTIRFPFQRCFHRMKSVLLLHVPCYYTGILLLLATLFNRLVYS